MPTNYITDPNDVEALVGSIKAFFNDAADRRYVNIDWAVELLTATVHLVDPNYEPPEPAEMDV